MQHKYEHLNLLDGIRWLVLKQFAPTTTEDNSHPILKYPTVIMSKVIMESTIKWLRFDIHEIYNDNYWLMMLWLKWYVQR